MLKARPVEDYDYYNLENTATRAENLATSLSGSGKNYYKTKSYECWDVVQELCEGCDPWESVLKSNIIKYIWRYPWKNGLQDLHKAEDYLFKLVDYVQNKKGE